MVGGPGREKCEPGKSSGDMLGSLEIEKLGDLKFYTPPTPNPGKRSFFGAKKVQTLFLVWLLDQYSNLVQMIFLKRSSKKSVPRKKRTFNPGRYHMCRFHLRCPHPASPGEVGGQKKRLSAIPTRECEIGR